MSILQPIDLDFSKAETELSEFRAFLQSNSTFSETEVVGQLKSRVNLSCLLGSMIAGVPRPDRYRFEFLILGVFRADLVVGNSQQNRFALVEFEGGEKGSIFSQKRINRLRPWSRQLENGFSQLVDWAWTKHDAGNTEIFRNSFGSDQISAIFVLVCGRDQLMDPTDRKRFYWRRDHVQLSGTPATCLTYDDLLLFFEATVEATRSYGSRTPSDRVAPL